MCALPALPALATAQGTLALRMQPTIAGVPDGKSGVPAPVYMEGDRMQGHSERETEALGNARARSRGQAIAADWMRFDSRFNELTAIGNVQLEQGAYVAQGVRLRYDFDTERGVMERAKYFINPRATGNLPIAAVPSGVMPTASTSAARQGMSGRGVAERILFEGPGQFHAQRASFTTCEPDNDQWNIRSNDLRIYRDEGVGVARNATVDFKGTPIFYAPYFSFPLHQERKTGFLAPYYGTTSASGFEVTTPFFWNLAPNYDLTITPRVLSKRGLQLRNDFRYLMPAYKGELHVEVLPDDRVSDRTRHLLQLRHSHTLSNGWAGADDLETGVRIDQPRAYAQGKLMGVVNAIVAAELILGKDGSEVDVLQAAFEIGDIALIAIGDGYVVGCRFQRLQIAVAEDIRLALEVQPRQSAEGRQGARGVRQRGGVFVDEIA